MALEVDVLRGEVTFEEVGQEVMCCFTSGRGLILSDFIESIELVNGTFAFFQLVWKGRRVFTKDRGCGFNVNQSFSDDDLD